MSKNENLNRKSMSHIIKRSGLFLLGLVLCLIGIGIPINKQLLLLNSDIHDKSMIVTLIGIGLPLIIAGIGLASRPKKIYVYLISTGILIDIIAIAFFNKSYPGDWYYPVVGWIFLSYILGIILLITIIFINISSPIGDVSDDIPFYTLREKLDNAITMSENTGSQLRHFKDELEVWEVENWKSKKEIEEKYYRMTTNIFLLLDHYENFIKVDKKSEVIDRFYKNTLRILEDEGIEEIPVTKGECFDSTYHKHVASRSDKLPENTILQVSRKGYYKKGIMKEDDIILRPAEVIISNGNTEK